MYTTSGVLSYTTSELEKLSTDELITLKDWISETVSLAVHRETKVRLMFQASRIKKILEWERHLA